MSDRMKKAQEGTRRGILEGMRNVREQARADDDGMAQTLGPLRGLLNERGSTHGDFEENGKIMQCLKDEMHFHFGWNKLTPWQREALDMIQHKIGRILCGDANYFDHWRDIAGYAKLVEERCPTKPENEK